jgi:hypothetical protein
MKFDLIYEMQTLKPHGERSEYVSYWQALAQIELADEMRFVRCGRSSIATDSIRLFGRYVIPHFRG